MTYDFTSIMDRHGKDAIAVDGLGTDLGFAPDPPRDGFDVIPMWVADMNFPTVPTVPQAIIERAQHPVYGYFSPTDDYYNSIIDWQSTRNVCFVKLGSAFCAVFFRSVGSGFSAGCAVSAAACLRCVVVVLLVYLVMRACSLR